MTPTIAAVRTTPFDKLILVSWLNDAGKDVVFVQNTDTSEVQKVTNDPNPNNLKLVEIHKNPDPQKAEVVLSNGAEQGSVKFRLEAPPASPQVEGGQPPAVPPGGAPSKFPAAAPGMPLPPVPGMSRQMQLQQNAQQQGSRGGAAQVQQGAVPTQSGTGTTPPRASEVRRKRITPPPTNEQPVGTPVPYPESLQSISATIIYPMHPRLFCFLLIGLMNNFTAARGQEVVDQPTPKSSTEQEPLSSFQAINATIDTILMQYEQLTGKILIKDSNLAANALPITISVPQPVPKGELVRLIEASLLLNNIVLVPAQEPNSVKVININTGKNPRSEGVRLFSGPESIPEGEQVISYYMPFRVHLSERSTDCLSNPYSAKSLHFVCPDQ